MKNISELLNLLSSNPAEAPGLLMGRGAVAPKGTQTGNGSFEDVLSRLASQTGNSQNSVPSLTTPPSNQGQTEQFATSGPVGVAGTSTSVSETTISIAESVKVSNPAQLNQAEQALASLAVGLAHLLQLMSQLNQGNSQQVQTTLKSLGLGPAALAGLQNLLNGLQAFLQKIPPGQNPLALSPSQQTALLGQLFQQMIQNQQVLLGVAPTAQTGASSNNLTSGSGNAQVAVLQVNFFEAQASQLQIEAGNTQASQVFINLQTFKMSATFFQEGQTSKTPIIPQNSQDLLNTLNQALGKLNLPSNTAIAPAGSMANSASQNELNQNFRNLVQLLMQSGVSQAALTTFMKNQQSENGNNAFSNQANAVFAVPSANAGPKAPVENPPVNPVEVTTESTNNANAAQPPRSIANTTPTPLVAEVPQTQPEAASHSGLIAPVAGNNLEFQPKTTVTTPVNRAIVSNEGGNTAAVKNVTTRVQPPTAPPTQTEGLPLHEVTVLNNTVDRLNAVAAQILTTKQNFAIEISAHNTVATQPEPNPVTVQPAAQSNQTPAGKNNFSPRQTAILNDTEVRVNASSLHTIEGSIGGNNTTPEINLTEGQVLSAQFATNLNNPLPPTFGNPSVPITAPTPTRQAPVFNTAVETAVGPRPEFQSLENTAAPAILLNSTQEGAVFSGPGINVSTTTQEPINRAVPLNSQAINTLSPVNQTLPLNNGAGPVSIVGNNNINSTAAAFATTSNPAVTSNPGQTATPAPNTVVPLPQPATLPVGTNPSAAQNALPGAVPAVGLVNLAVLPPPTSQAPIVPATAVVGEGVKGEIPATTVPRNENFANPSAVANVQPLSSVMPISPEAVAPSGTVLETATGLGTLNVTDKNVPNNQAVLEANALLGLATTSNQPVNLTHTSTPTSISGMPGANFDTTSLLSQISQQMAAQGGAHSVSRLSFQLMPESLGRVTVQIALVDQSVSARILVTNPQVRENLQTHMVDLKTALNQAGLQIDQLQVQVQGGGGNLLAQYYQYQQEGFGYRQPVPLAPTGTEGPQNVENSGDLGGAPVRMSLVDVLA